MYKQGLYGKFEESDEEEEEEEEVDNGEVPIETTEDLCEEDMELMTAMGFSSFGGSKREQTSQKVTFLCNCKMFGLYNGMALSLPIIHCNAQTIDFCGGCHGRDHMVVGFTTTYACSACHH